MNHSGRSGLCNKSERCLISMLLDAWQNEFSALALVQSDQFTYEQPLSKCIYSLLDLCMLGLWHYRRQRMKFNVHRFTLYMKAICQSVLVHSEIDSTTPDGNSLCQGVGYSLSASSRVHDNTSSKTSKHYNINFMIERLTRHVHEWYLVNASCFGVG